MNPVKSLFALPLLAVALGAAAHAADPAPLPPPPTDVVKVDHTKVEVMFKRGGALIDNNALFKVQAGRRVAPAGVEIHTADTDIFYILDGSATFVTGGTAVDTKEIGPGEIRGKSITGGTERHLAKGDVIVIPNGVPHQFTQVDGPFLYFVVKVTKTP